MKPILWLTGLPASGKSTLARLAAEALAARGVRVEILDGEAARSRLSPELGFSEADRKTHTLRLAAEARTLSQEGATVIVAAISPYRESRDQARALIGSGFFEIHVSCPLDVCRRRDPKGLYRKAKAGELRRMTGVDDPYEPPLHPDLVVETDRETPADGAARLVALVASGPRSG